MFEDGEDEGLLFRVHGGDEDTFVGDDAVVAIGATEVSLVVMIPATVGHGWVAEEFEDLGGLLLRRGEALHQGEAEALFLMEDACACIAACVDQVGLRTGEPGGDDDLGAVEEDTEAEVVAVEGESPWRGCGGFAEEDEVVGELVAHAGSLHKVAEEAVDPHGAEGFGVAFRGEGCFDGGEHGVAHLKGEFVQADALVAEQKLGVGPRAPLGRVDVVAHLG